MMDIFRALTRGWNRIWRGVGNALMLLWMLLLAGVLLCLPVGLAIVGISVTIDLGDHTVYAGLDHDIPRLLDVLAGCAVVLVGFTLTYRIVRFIWPLFYMLAGSIGKHMDNYLPVKLHS